MPMTEFHSNSLMVAHQHVVQSPRFLKTTMLRPVLFVLFIFNERNKQYKRKAQRIQGLSTDCPVCPVCPVSLPYLSPEARKLPI